MPAMRHPKCPQDAKMLPGRQNVIRTPECCQDNKTPPGRCQDTSRIPPGHQGATETLPGHLDVSRILPGCCQDAIRTLPEDSQEAWIGLQKSTYSD